MKLLLVTENKEKFIVEFSLEETKTIASFSSGFLNLCNLYDKQIVENENQLSLQFTKEEEKVNKKEEKIKKREERKKANPFLNLQPKTVAVLQQIVEFFPHRKVYSDDKEYQYLLNSNNVEQQAFNATLRNLEKYGHCTIETSGKRSILTAFILHLKS
jgi:hypothetical protein